MLLSRGKVAYNGPVAEAKDYFARLGHEVLPALPHAS
jgi:hypothetical protein